MKLKVTQLCLTHCDPMDYTVHGLLQARILEWVEFSFSRRSSLPRDWTRVSRIVGRHFTIWATREAQSESYSVMSDSLWPHGLYNPWNSSGQKDEFTYDYKSAVQTISTFVSCIDFLLLKKKKKPIVLRSLTQCLFIISQLHREDIWYCMARFSTPAKIKILASCVLIWSSGTSFKFISVMSRIQLFPVIGLKSQSLATC